MANRNFIAALGCTVVLTFALLSLVEFHNLAPPRGISKATAPVKNTTSNKSRIEPASSGIDVPLEEHIESAIVDEVTMTDKNNDEEATKNVSDEDHLTLKSYTYSNCPFSIAKFSQFHLSSEGPFSSEADRRMNSKLRAKMALDLSNDNRAFERVSAAFEKGAFNRTIVLDGDSLTRQLFISLGCLAWSAGYVEDFEIPHKYVSKGDENSILLNAHYAASSFNYNEAHIKFYQGGDLYYISNPIKEKIEILSERMIHDACEKKKKRYNARIHFDEQLLPMKKKDVVVLAAGHHIERTTYIPAYKKFFQCIKDDSDTGDNALARWPAFLYQMSSVESFWTENGRRGGTKQIPEGEDFESCKPNVPHALDREEEMSVFSDLVTLLGKDIDLNQLGEYHVQHGDCLHWIQPGVPDIIAAELADSLTVPLGKGN